MADVVVVGAGLAGLETARRLVARGVEPLVLEARPRVGGRLLNGRLEDGAAVELGGQWLGPGQNRMAALVRELGVETFPTWTKGENLLQLGDKRVRYSGTIPRLAPHVLADIAQVQFRLERMARQVTPQRPWAAPRAAQWDGQTLWSWLSTNARTRSARTLFAVACRTVWGATPEELSLLQVLFYVRAAGGLDSLLDTEGGAQQDRVVGGSQVIAELMAEELGERVVLSAPVRRIDWGADGVTVRWDGGEAEAGAVVVAIPPLLAARISFAPALPARRDQLMQRMPAGALTKCVCAYDEPFWRADGLTGEALYDRGPVTLTFDNSPPSGTPGVMLGFVGGPEARAFSRLDEGERRAAVIDCFVRLFGPRAAEPREYLEQAWGEEEWSGGGPTSFFTTGGWTAYGPFLREPVGPIHWAGTETATHWSGYMEGALQSGRRAAAEALEAVQERATLVKPAS